MSGELFLGDLHEVSGKPCHLISPQGYELRKIEQKKTKQIYSAQGMSVTFLRYREEKKKDKRTVRKYDLPLP